MKIKFSLLLLAVSLLSLIPLQSRADTIALTFSNASGSGIAKDTELGWSFSLSTNVLVTQLGSFDGPNGAFGNPNGDGLQSNQLVTIWTSTGTMVTSATVLAGGGTLDSDFRFVSIAPTLLTAGNYVISNYYDPNNLDRNTEFNATVNTAPGVTYGDARGPSSGGHAFPTFVFSGNGIWGPNFQFVAAPPNGNGVPEAGSSWILLALSLGGTFGLRVISKRRLA